MTISTINASGGSKGGVPLTGAQRALYSREIQFQAQPLLVSAQFAVRKTEMGRNKGDTIKFTKYNDLVGSARLSEVEAITTTNLSASQSAITVDEFGFAVAESERLVVTGWDDVIARATMLLGQHYGKTVDAMVQDEFRAVGSQQAILVAGRANRNALTSADTMNVDAIKDAAEVLAVSKAPKIGGAYVCLIHPHTARVLRDDSAWLEAHKYAAPQNIFMGEVGMIEGVRFVETTFLPVIKKSTGTVLRDMVATGATEAVVNATLDVYQSLMLGGNCVGWAEALPVEFRDGGIKDFGRTHELAWYSIMGAGRIESNAVLIESV